jgi:cell wall-associated NlpC family hydrolase
LIGLAAKLALALGVDGLARWLVGAVVTLICVSLLVALIVVQTVATVLTGGQSDGWAPTGATPPTGATIPLLEPTLRPPLDTSFGSRAIQLAQTWLGVPYLFGGCSRGGVDCSCLVQNVYAALGIHLPRVAVDQFNMTSPIKDPQPGDLVFFANTYAPGISHVGIYIGNGLQINAPMSGEVVSVAPVFTGYWGAHYAGAHRVRT